MGNPEMPHEDMENKEGSGSFLITFPDGSVGKFNSRMEAADALNDWKEAA